jgi:hypothetical protein
MAVETVRIVVEETRSGKSLARRALLIGLIAGFILTVIWSASFVDRAIGGTIADNLLGYEAGSATLTGPVMAVVFALVSGVAGTFTACNIAGMSAVAPLMAQDRVITKRETLRAIAKPLAWLALAMCALAAVYGFVGVLMRDSLPQLSQATTEGGVPIRLIQSSVVFGIVGLAFTYLGLASLGYLPDVLNRLRERHPRTDVVVMGVLIGAFLIGRPFALFRTMFEYAASTGNPFLGSATFVLQALGNIIIMALLFVLLFVFAGGRFRNWLAASPGRIERFTGGALILAGSFTFIYWVLRVPARIGAYGWWPTIPWS